MSPRARLSLVTALTAVVACKSAPTTVLLRLEVERPVAVSRLVLTVFDEGGQVTSTRLGAGAVALPSDVVLYPRGPGALRILARGFEGDAVVGEGVASVTARAGEQVVATLRYAALLLRDQDGDGVPDAIDRCPAWPNPSQQACAGPDAIRDAPADAAKPDQKPKPDQKVKPDQKQKLDKPPLDLLKADQPRPPDLPVACVASTQVQGFEQGMVGCAAKVAFPARATLCAAAFRVCTAAEWVSRRGGKLPTHAYWTDDALHYGGTVSACYVLASGGTACSDPSSPMRVCPPTVPDPLGNTCKWTNCGSGQATPNEYFGGCTGDLTAGALCCPK
jgi:hypothetical protein